MTTTTNRINTTPINTYAVVRMLQGALVREWRIASVRDAFELAKAMAALYMCGCKQVGANWLLDTDEPAAPPTILDRMLAGLLLAVIVAEVRIAARDFTGALQACDGAWFYRADLLDDLQDLIATDNVERIDRMTARLARVRDTAWSGIYIEQAKLGLHNVDRCNRCGNELGPDGGCYHDGCPNYDD